MSPRVLFYVQHLLGVGHVKRAAAISRAMLAGGLDVTVALGGEPVPLAEFGAAKVRQLPPVRARDQSFQMLVDEDGREIDEGWWARRRKALLGIDAELKPDVLLVEHFPFGRRKFRAELLPLFEACKDRTVIACSVRDVLVDKGDAAKQAKIVALARRWFAAILVHGDPDVIPFGATFRQADRIADLLRYTGYIADPPGGKSGRGSWGADDGGSGGVVVSTGGGAVGAKLLEAALAARLEGTLADCHWRLLAGRNLAPEVLADLCRRAPENVTVEWARADFPTLLAKAGLSISQGGYNTLMDILIAGCPAIVVPFAAGEESEQAFRAKRFAGRGLLRVLDENALNEEALTRLASETYCAEPDAPSVRAAPGINLDGAAQTAEMVRELAGTSRGGR